METTISLILGFCPFQSGTYRSIMEVLLAKMQCGGQYFSRSEKFVAFKEALRSYSKHQQQLLKKAPLS